MKRIIVLIAIAVVGLTDALAQQVPMYSHYYYNRFLYNPALAGNQDYGQLILVNRNQWNSIPGAPKTTAFTVDGPLKQKNIGMGLAIYRDQAGEFNITGAQAAYRYGLKLDADQTINFGLSLGVLDNRIDFFELNAPNPLDPVIANSYQNATGFDANIGVNYTWKTLNIGLTVPQIVAGDLAYESLVNKATLDRNDYSYGLVRHIITHASYDWDINGDGVWWLEPIAMARFTPGAPVQFDINARVSYMKKYWLGAMYRSAYAATVSAGLKVANQIVAGYAYDFALHNNDIDLKSYTRGAHEVMVGYQFGGNVMDDPDLKKKLEDIDKKIKNNETDIDSVGDELDKAKDDIKKNKDDIEDNDDDIEEIKKKLKGFDDFMNLFDEMGRPKAGPNDIKMSDGTVYTFKNVYFATNKWDIRDIDVTELNTLTKILKNNPGLKIEVAGHADERGTESYNIWLSNKRSNAVRDYLIKQGVNASQLEIKGYGEGVPASDVYDENRRVEFKILSNK
ncbi:MAG: PorP/SprF family type IX secretion system membrane protein [Flavobacteriales bacterium]|nr:PorP/SprF family type IX secretion system membrane protein [Flavobacteriales bacterium]